LITGKSDARLYQNSSWTSSGVPRKNQMYSQLEPEISGFGGLAHDREDHPEHDPDQHGQDRQPDRGQYAMQDARVEQILADDAPLESLRRDDRSDDRRRDDDDDRRGDPPSRVPNWDGLDLLGPPRWLLGLLGGGHR
jgi:hypothetical protein